MSKISDDIIIEKIDELRSNGTIDFNGKSATQLTVALSKDSFLGNIGTSRLLNIIKSIIASEAPPEPTFINMIEATSDSRSEEIVEVEIPVARRRRTTTPITHTISDESPSTFIDLSNDVASAFDVIIDLFDTDNEIKLRLKNYLHEFAVVHQTQLVHNKTRPGKTQRFRITKTGGVSFLDPTGKISTYTGSGRDILCEKNNIDKELNVYVKDLIKNMTIDIACKILQSRIVETYGCLNNSIITNMCSAPAMSKFTSFRTFIDRSIGSTITLPAIMEECRPITNNIVNNYSSLMNLMTTVTEKNLLSVRGDYAKTVLKVFKLRNGVLWRDEDNRETEWSLARDNIQSLDSDNEIINTWKYVMRSEFMKYVFMYNAPTSSIITAAMNLLISHIDSCKLFVNELLPIGYIFLPIHYGTAKLNSISQCLNLSTNKDRRKYIVELKRGAVESVNTDINTNAWMFSTESTGRMVTIYRNILC